MMWFVGVVLAYAIGRAVLWVWLFYAFMDGKPSKAAQVVLGSAQLMSMCWHHPVALAYLCKAEMEQRDAKAIKP